MLKYGLDKSLAAIVSKRSLNNQIFELVGIAESEGWLKDLTKAAKKANPNSPYWEGELFADSPEEKMAKVEDKRFSTFNSLNQQVYLSEEAKTVLLEAVKSREASIVRLPVTGSRKLLQVNGEGKVLNKEASSLWGPAIIELYDNGLLKDNGFEKQEFRVSPEGRQLAEQILSEKDAHVEAKLAIEEKTTSEKNFDVLLVTVTDIEFQSVRQYLQEKDERQIESIYRGNKTYYNLGEINNTQVGMVRSGMGTGGASGSMMTVSQAIDAMKPKSIIICGIAFGMDSEKQDIGSVLVSERILEYELQRIGTDSQGKSRIIPRGDRVSVSPRLLDRLHDGADFWEEGNAEFGLILSGSKLVDNIDFRSQLKKLEPEAIGGEMEAAGVYSAALSKKVDWIAVKAICDYADGQKSKNKKENQRIAAKQATSLVFCTIERGGLAPEPDLTPSTSPIIKEGDTKK